MVTGGSRTSVALLLVDHRSQLSGHIRCHLFRLCQTNRHRPATHPFAQTLQSCGSADAIFNLLRDKANEFQAYRDGNRKLINCLKLAVQVLHAVTGILGEAAALVSPMNQLALYDRILTAFLVGADVLLSVRIFECVANFLDRLRIYTKISPSISGIITKIMAEVLSVLSLALATKQIKQGCISE